jgi:hypothetical protein
MFTGAALALRTHGVATASAAMLARNSPRRDM